MRPSEVFAIDLGRKKKPRKPRAIYAYTTALTITLAQLKRSVLARGGTLVLVCIGMLGLFADLLASDLPIVCSMHGTVYVLPAVSRPPSLVGFDCERVRDEGDWSIRPLVPFGPSQTGTKGVVEPFASPSIVHPFGTDSRGRDVAARVIHGARTSLVIGIISAAAFVGIGVLLGAMSGFFGGFFDAVVSRVVETLTSFPTLVLVLVIQALVPHATMTTMLLALALTRWTEVARLVRAEVVLVASQDYITAARALGASSWRVLRRHVLPNAVAPALVASALGISSVVLVEASLGFLRVGLPEAVPSWGQTLSEARTNLGAWWLLAFPGLMVFLTVASLNLVGEALRDALDPRLRDAVRVGHDTASPRVSRG